MSNSGKRRMCPAIGSEITSADCGEHRGSKYDCPPHCGFNPMAPANYDQLLELETAVDKKTMEWLVQSAEDPELLSAGGRVARGNNAYLASHSFFTNEIFFRLGKTGQTCAQRWEAAGFLGMKNDERVLFRAKMQVRVVLIEVQSVLDEQRIEVVDLIADHPQPFILMDRSTAARATRFATLLAWVYPLPHFWRLHGALVFIPDYAGFHAREILTEIVHHLGGPLDEARMRGWLAGNLLRTNDALIATSRARQRRLLEGVDSKFGKVIYELRRPFAECRAAIDADVNVAEDPLSGDERDEGFAEARVWFDDEKSSPVTIPQGGRQVLGRVLLGQSHWRLEAMGEANTAELRRVFESRMGERVKFSGQRLDNIGAMMAEKEPAFDPALVPPRLLVDPSQLHVGVARIPVSPTAAASKTDLEDSIWGSQDRAWLEESVPALNGKTPRAAALDAALRPVLIQLMKTRVRQCDEHNLESGSNYDVNWMLRELGLDEILRPPPPVRAIPVDLADEDREDDEPVSPADLSLPLAPPLPDRPFTAEEVIKSSQETMQSFDRASDGMEEMLEAGSTLIEDTCEITEELVEEEMFSILVPFLIQIWFLFIPRGTRGPELDFDRFYNGVHQEMTRVLGAAPDRSAPSYELSMAAGPQPEAVDVFTSMLIGTISKLEKKSRPSREMQAVMSGVIKAVIDEMDRACRE